MRFSSIPNNLLKIFRIISFVFDLKNLSQNSIWAVSLSFLSITLYELLVLIMSLTGYGQKIIEGERADRLTL